MYMRSFVLLLLLWAGVQSAQATLFADSASQETFLPVDQAFSLSVQPQANGETLLHWDIAPGYYLYQKRLTFSGLPADATPVLPEPLPHSDEYFGDSPIYRERLALTLPAGLTEPVVLGWQGCADAGLCYPPQTHALKTGSAGTAAAGLAEDQALAGGLEQQALWLSLVLFFGLGLLLAFTPCSLPMLPILAGIVVGSGASPRRGVALAASYVVSMALVYAALGVLAAALGANLQSVLQQPWLLASFAGLFVLLALPMFGVFELQLPEGLRSRLANAGQKQRGGSLVGAGILGVLSGLLVGPCMTAPLAAALLFIAQSGNALHGGLVLFALGLGIGAPLVLLVTLGNRFLPKPGEWMNRIKVLFGFLFLVAALLVVRPLLAEPLWLGLWGVLVMFAASAMLHLSRDGRHRAPGLALAALLAVWGVAMVVGAAAGSGDALQPLKVFAGGAGQASQGAAHATTLSEPAALDRELAAAKAQGQWVLIDYYADWCVSCKVMEKTVFADPRVQASLAGVRVLRPDVTRSNAASRELLGRYQVLGPPTLLWIGPDGLERRARRITGEVDAEQFLARWADTREQG